MAKRSQPGGIPRCRAGLLSTVLAGERVQALVAAAGGFGAAAALSVAEARAVALTGPYTSPEYGFRLALGMLAALGTANAARLSRRMVPS